MIFPPESVYEFRRELAAKMDSGANSPTPRPFARRWPWIPTTLPPPVFSRLTAEEARRPRRSPRSSAHRFILANPVSHEGYLLLGRVLPDPPLAAAYAALGKKKLHFDPEAQRPTGPRPAKRQRRRR